MEWGRLTSMDMTRERPLSNRYLRWLDQGMAPPVRGSLGKAEEAAQVLHRRILRAMRQLRANATRAHLDAYDLHQKNLFGLMALVDNQSTISKRMPLEASKAWATRWHRISGRYSQQLLQNLTPQHFRSLLRTDPCPILAQRVQDLFDSMRLNPQIAVRDKHLTERQDRREAAYVAQRTRIGGVWLLGNRVDNLHRDYVRQARQAAREREPQACEPKLLFAFQREESEAAAGNADHPELRQMLWEEGEHAPVSMKAVQQMLQTRHERAQAFDQATYADFLLGDRMAVAQPKAVLRILEKSRSALRQTAQRYLQVAQDLAKAEGFDASGHPHAPWHQSFYINNANHSSGFETRKIFPWRETAPKVFQDLLHACGWHLAQPMRASGEGIWTVLEFHVCNEQGQQAHLLYSPFRPKQTTHSYSLGAADCLLSAWHPAGPRTPAIWINQALNTQEQAFSVDDLRVLCHEIGHALHFASLPGRGPDEVENTPEDLMEVPSYLLERYHADPSVLARWASRKGPAAAQRRRFWVRKLRPDDDMAVSLLNELRDAAIDLDAHGANGLPGFESVARLHYAKDGMTIFPGDNTWRRHFIWETGYACMDYTHILSQGLVRRIATVPDNGCVQGDAIVAAYRSLMERVLVRVQTPRQAGRLWADWAGESLLTSMTQGALAQATQAKRISRKRIAQLRKKIARLNAKA